MNLQATLDASRTAASVTAAESDFKTILVHVEPPPAGENRLAAAVSLAARFDAALVGVGGGRIALFDDPSFTFVSPEAVQMLSDLANADLAASAAAFKAAAKGAGIDHAWRGALDYPEKLMAANACAADLVLATARNPGSLAGFADPGDLMMTCGLPVLVLPPQARSLNARRVLIAWKNTREARRAVADALPFLRAAEHVMIVAIPEFAGQDLEPELTDVSERLRRHGVTADCEASPHLEISVAEQLTAIADSRQADLLVAGGYGHSRLREWAFGGVTEHLLANTTRAVFFSR